LLAAWAQGQPLAGADHWWLVTSLILFVAVGVLAPTVFLPHGKIFESALEDAKQRGEGTPELRTAPRDDRRVLGLPGESRLRRAVIDCEEDRTLRAVLVGMLREADRGR
jgi:hypothetical protein